MRPSRFTKEAERRLAQAQRKALPKVQKVKAAKAQVKVEKKLDRRARGKGFFG